MSDLAELVIGSLIGAGVGSVLGYLASYHLAGVTRRENAELRRRRLMRALVQEIALNVPTSLGDLDPTYEVDVISGVHLATLVPLLDLVADLPDEGLLIALATLHSEATNFNDGLLSVNQVTLNPELRHLREAAHEWITGEYMLVQKAAQQVLELLQIRA